jgi:hypothetical protein
LANVCFCDSTAVVVDEAAAAVVADDNDDDLRVIALFNLPLLLVERKLYHIIYFGNFSHR